MHKLRLLITETAISDMDSIFDYISKDNIVAAKNLINSFNEAFQRLQLFPGSGFTKPEFVRYNVRISIVANHYQIIYFVNDDTIYIQRVLSGYQDICSKLL